MRTASIQRVEHESLSQAVTHILEECRMVLPGIQALFGFQLVAVFNATFWEKLSASEQRIHLLALGLLAVAIALVMTPAAYHRRVEPETVSRNFVLLSTRVLRWSLVPLAGAICLDLYLIARLILQSQIAGVLVSALALVVFIALWAVLPWQNMKKGFFQVRKHGSGMQDARAHVRGTTSKQQ
jgi:hypothetical protein